MAASDLRRQFLAENSQLLSFWRANVRREVSTDGGAPPLWSKKNQLRKLAGGQPGETAAIANSTEGQAPVAVKTVPAQVGGLERFAAHGLHWVPEEGLYFTNLDRHVRGRPLNTGELRSSIACAGFVCFIPLFGRPAPTRCLGTALKHGTLWLSRLLPDGADTRRDRA